MRSWTITESTTTDVEGFQLGWLPPGAYDYVAPQVIRTRGGRDVVALEAKAYVGRLPLLNGDELNIIPRAGGRSFGRMLVVSEGLAEPLQHEFDDFIHLGQTEEDLVSWTSLLARPFIRQLHTIEHNSLRPERIRIGTRQESARGRVKLLPTAISVALREARPVHCSFSERTYETKEHRVLGAAALRLLQLGKVEPDDRHVAYRWAERLQGGLRPGDLFEVVAGLRTQRYAGPRAYYIQALLMARLLLAEGGIALDSDEAIISEAQMTNVRTLFERYVRALLRHALEDEGFIVEKRERNPEPLFDDGSYDLIPDALVSKAGLIHLALDAKYKIDRPIESADYYQMEVYLSAYGVREGMLILPTIKPIASMLTRRSVLGHNIHELRLPLDNWKATEAALTTEVRKLLKIPPSPA